MCDKEKVQEIKEIMEEISNKIDKIKVEIAKANERNTPTSSFNVAALHRMRQLLVSVSKIGIDFRKKTVAYQKGRKKKM